MQVMNSMPAMTNEILARMAPSIMAEHASPNVSHIYKQVRTLDVVDLMRDQGWMPVQARQLAVRTADRREFCKHEIKFQRENDTSLSAVGDETLQAVLTNSHDRSSTFHFMLGVFRLACTNGMVVASGMFNEIRVRHVGFDPQQIRDVAMKMAEGGKLVGDHIGEMRNVLLEREEQLVLAKSSAQLLFDPDDMDSGKVDFDTSKLLGIRRMGDAGDNLWKVFNRIQENTTRGGLRYHRAEPGVVDGTVHTHKATTRQIKSIDRDIRLNQALWTLAESMLKIKTKVA